MQFRASLLLVVAVGLASVAHASSEMFDFDTSQPLLLIDQPLEGVIYPSDSDVALVMRSLLPCLSNCVASVVYKRSPQDSEDSSCGVSFKLPFNTTISLTFSQICRKLGPGGGASVDLALSGSARFMEIIVVDAEDGYSQMASNHIHFLLRPPPPSTSPSLCSPPPPFSPSTSPGIPPCITNVTLSSCPVPLSPPPPSFCSCLNLIPRAEPAFLVDSFTFSHLLEIDLLRVRVRELRGVVDRFMLLEAGTTFQGQPRPFLFDEAQSLVDDLIDGSGSSFDTIQVENFPSGYLSFAAETYLRDSVLLSGALNTTRDGDTIIIISDVDEVPSRAAAIAMKYCSGYTLPLALDTHSFNYNLGWSHQWRLVQARAILLSQLSPGFLPSDVRVFPHPSTSNVTTFLGAGWHFTNFGGVDMILQKMNTFSHTEYKGTYKADPDRLNRFISLGLDVFREEDDQLEMKCYRSLPSSALVLPHLLHEDPILFKKWSGE